MAVTAPMELEIEKVYNGEYWVNHYYLNSADLSAAGSPAAAILNAERAFHDSRITFTKFTVRTTADLDYVYTTVPVNLPGLSGAGASDLMPLFVVMRVDMGATAGPPSRKYYRGVLKEDAVTGMQINSAFISGTATAVAALAAVTALCDPQGDDIITALINPNVGMRQLRRGSKKKVIPS